ncbi:Titin [Phytophthora citrophthora]|uniref:Titin n=1 Tax=Phytophthora citrophthora TaxID=4793 RepID=A0AAD9LM53_9STRA|nr:Titin [Phytophthora citrophthora]
MGRSTSRRLWTLTVWKTLAAAWTLLVTTVSADFFTPGDVPGPPEKILVSPASDSSIRVQFLPPLNVKPEGVNGAPVLGYKVEVARRVDEVQTFSVAATGPILAGGYKLIFKNDLGTETTSCISWDASEVEFEMALEELPNVDSVGVSRSAYSATKNGYVYTVTFDGAYLVSGAQTNLLKGDTTGCQAVQPPNRMLSFEPARVTAGVSGFYPEVWEIVSTDTSNAQVLGGTFDLSVGFEGEWVYTNPVVRATIAAGSRTATTDKPMLGVVNRGDRVRIHGEVFKVHLTAPFTDKVLPLDSYHVHGVSAVGGVAIEVMDTALGNVQVENGQTAVTTSGDFSGRIGTGDQIRIGSHYVEVGAVVSGTVTLKSGWTGGTALHVTAFARKKTTLRASAEAAEMKRALSSLPGVGSVDVSRVGPTNSNGYRWYITFQSLDNVNLRVDKKIGTSYFIDVYGDTCTNCKITASIVQDDTQATTFREIKGDYAASAVVATQEVGGVIAEVQTISTKASADDISGSFTISFQSVGGAVINFDDTAADVRTKLQSLSTIGRLNVIRTANTDFGATWTITFLSNLGDLRLLSVDDQTLLKGTGVNVVVQEVVKGVDVDFETIIEGLDPGQDYYVRAFARNENGYGTSTTDLQQRGRGALPLLTTVATSPDPPGINGMWPLSGSQMELRLSTPVDHGDPISKYVLEYAVGDTFGTVGTKKLFIYSSIENDITGTFRLQYGDDISTMLSVHTTASSLRSALNSLPSIRPVSVTRGLYVVIDGPGVSFSVANKRVITTALTATQCKMLEKGVRIEVGNKRFTVRVQPVEGATAIDVEPGDGVVGLGNVGVVKIDDSGNQRGPYGYQWTISFDNDVGDIAGLQVTSLLTSVSTGTGLPVTSSGIKVGEAAVPPAHYGYFEINNDENVCDTYVVGAPSAVQVVRLFAPTTVTAGTFQLKLGSETTGCITLGKLGTPSTMKKLLENLNLVSKVTVEEVRAFKVSVLFGSAKSKVTDYSNGILTIVSTDTSVQPNDGLTADQVTILLKDSIIQVSRNPNDFTRHSCEFVIGATPSVGAKQISATAVGSCSAFQNEARALKILDFHDYNVRFWGHYPTGEWPTLQFDPIAFGTGTGTGSCAAWAPSGLKIYGQIHSVKYEGVCSKGQAGIQTILADGSSTIGGTFTLSYLGKVTPPLSFRDTGAAEMRDAIDLITASGTVDVSVSQYGTYGKAWHVTFMQIGDDDQDAIFIQHSRLTGQNALISVYPTVTVFTDAKRDDIRGSFRLTINGETTEPIGYSATHMKVAQELQKLSVVDSVVALGAVSAGDIGVYALELKADATGSSLLNVKLDGSTIDPTKFLAVGDTLKVGSSLSTTIQSLTPDVITMVDSVGSTSTLNADIYVGQITKQTKPLPGFVGTSPLIQVLAVTSGSNMFQLPANHGFGIASPNNVFYIGGATFTVASVSMTDVVTTNEDYQGESVVAGYPEVYIFNNELETTENLLNLVKVNDHLWLPSVSADMNKYLVRAITARSIRVTGNFANSIARTRAYHVSNGRKWNLVFRSFHGSLDTIDAIPEQDWRGTDARIGTRSPKAVAPNVISVGNPATTQTIRLEVANPSIVTSWYTLSFAGETVVQVVAGVTTPKQILWPTLNDGLKEALESLDSVDGVTVVSTMTDTSKTVVHTISFWGTYPMKTLPLLVATPDSSNNLKIYVSGNDAVATTKQTTLILESSQAYASRIFAENSRGISDSVSVFQAQTSVSSVVPTPPTGVALGEFHGPTWLSLNYWAPFYSGGAEVTMYRIEWGSSPNFDSSSADYGVASIQEVSEVQQVTISYRSGAGAGGTFTLSWGGRVTSALPFDCAETVMIDALAIITETSSIAVDPVKVYRTQNQASSVFTWKITFLHNHGDLALLVADGRQLTGNFPQIHVVELVQGFSDLAVGDFTHEVQDVYTDAVKPVGGTFTLKFNGITTGPINFDASALELQTALQATSTSYSIKVSKAVRNAAINTAIWSVTFAYLRGEEMVGAGNIFTMTAISQLTGTNAVVRVASKVTGSDPFHFTLTDLRPGVNYYAHVMAYNADGFGSANSPLASAVTCSQPSAPQSVTASVVDGTTLAVNWGASEANGALCSVDKYRVEWYRDEGVQEQQTITTSAGQGLPEIQRLVNFADSKTLSGYFKLSFAGEVTENIRWDAAPIGAHSVKERLERLSTVGTVDVSSSSSKRVIPGLVVTSTGTTVTPLTVASLTAANLAQNDVIWIAGNKRTIMATPGATITIDSALEVTIPVPVFKSAYGYEWKITFLAGHVGPQKLIQVSPSDSWAGNNAGIVVNSIQKGLQPISGTFRVAFSSGGLSDSSPPLPHNISAIGLQTALEALVTIGGVKVSRSVNGYGFNWVVTFLSEFKNEISLLIVDGTELQGPGVKILAAQTREGVQPSFYCERDGTAGEAVEIGLPGQLNYVINGLRTGQKYAVRVRAHNSEGFGYAGTISPTFQIPRTTASAPQAVQLMALSSKLLKLVWRSPISDGGTTITSYQVQWDTSVDFTNPTKGDLPIAPTDAAPFYFNIPVPTMAKYYVRVVAMNERGLGAYGVPSPSNTMPLDRTPGRPEDAIATVLSSYAILVKWKPSSTEKVYYGGDGGLLITQYMVEWDKSPGFDSPPAFGLVDGTKRSYIIGGDDALTGVRSDILTAGTTYNIRVTAFNARGAGAPRPTTPSAVMVTNQPPSAPQKLDLSVVAANSVKAEWSNPLYDGGERLTSYQVEWDDQEDFASGQSSSATIPIIREMQSITLQSDVVNEEQFVDVTVKVTNEEQVVRTTFTGVDEVQTITTTNADVVDEIHKVVITATDRNEVQELRLDGDDIDEIQAVRTSVPDVLEVQTLKVGVARTNEVQTIVLTIPGAFANPSSIGGEFYLSFDSSICTHCVKKMYQRTAINLIGSLQDSTAARAALTVQTALIALANIDLVVVTRTQNSAGPTLSYTYVIEFTGLEVGGNVPELGIDAALTVTTGSGTTSVAGIPTKAQKVDGTEVAYASSATFTVTYTCESYSDPNAITTFSTACTPSPSDRFCAGCVTDFDGTTFTISQDLTSAASYVKTGAKLIAGVCSFEADVVTFTTGVSTTITVAADDVGLYCSKFSGKTLNLYKTPTTSTVIPLKTTETTITSSGVVEGFLTAAIDSVTVTRAELVDNTFVGSVYTLTIRKRSGTIPLLRCTAAAPATCTPARAVTGSMIKGTFQIGLVSEADAILAPTQLQYTTDIPWDASEADMKSILEGVTQNFKKVFGTVTVKRTVFSTGDKWSGGFTWQITFTSRGWDIPMMATRTVISSTTTLTTPTNGVPIAMVEDATHTLTPFANSRDGNLVKGTMMLKFREEAATIPCTIGTQTTLDTLDTSVRDTALETFFKDYLKIPTSTIMRSPATQARGFTWTITFLDPSTSGDVGPLQIVSSQITGKNAQLGVYEMTKGNQLGGKFQLSFNGETTAPIAFNAEASDMQTELNKLGTVKPSSVVVSRGDPTSPEVLGYTWYVTFTSSVWHDPTDDHSNGITGNWKSSTPASWDDVWESGYSKAWGRQVGSTFLLKCIPDGLTTTANDGSQKCDPAVSTPGVGPIRGSFTVSIDSTGAAYAHMAVNSNVASVAIPHNAWATKEQSGFSGNSVEEILEKMANVGDVSVTRSDVVLKTGGYTWTVTFLRDASDATHPCEQLEELRGSFLCNAPGDVPPMTVNSLLTGVVYVSPVKNGAILRGDFTNFRVKGDAGTDVRYQVTANCGNPLGSSCTVAAFTMVTGADTMSKFLLPGDRFTVGTFTCIFEVADVTATLVNIKSTSNVCPDMTSGNAGAANNLGISLRLPWNAEENLVERQLEAAATNTGRQVNVRRSVHGKYGEMSWLIRFISNPTYTPPGAGDLPDISTTFVPESGSSNYDVTVTQVTPGSKGLSGSFLLDFRSSSFGPREIFFNEDPYLLQRKLNEMDTIGQVTVKRFKYPSSTTGCNDEKCSGGWEDKAVQNSGTRGGYRWRIRFMQATGDYKGYTFPPGSGDVASLSVTRFSLQGTGVSVDVSTNVTGSSPITGTFSFNMSERQTPSLAYFSSAEDMELGIEAMDLFGAMDVTQGYLLTQKIPGATATVAQDGSAATITGVDDIRQFIAPTDIIRFGSTSIDNLAGTNGDTPFTGVVGTSRVSVTARSPVVTSSAVSSTKMLYPGMQLRIDGLVYKVQRTGHEVQTITATKPSGIWSKTYVAGVFRLSITRNGIAATPTTCLGFNEDPSVVQSAISGLMGVTVASNDVLVSRVGPVTVVTGASARIGYVYSIYFMGDTVAGDVATLKVSTSAPCSGIGDATVIPAVVTHGGKIPHQKLMLATDYGQVEDTSGFFKLELNSQTSACIKWGAPATDVEAELEKTPLSAGNVIVARSGNGTSQTEIQRIKMTANTYVTPVNPLFKVQFTLNGQTSATDCLMYGISAVGLQTALNGLASFGSVGSANHINVTRNGDGEAGWGYGYEYLIHFTGPISGGISRVLGNVPQLVIGNIGSGACMSGAQAGVYPALSVETIREGFPGFTYDIFFTDYKTAPTVGLMSLKTNDNGDNVCSTGWKHTGGSVRNAYVEMVELGGSSEIQVLSIFNKGATGAYKITFKSDTTSCLRFTATSKEVADALKAFTLSIDDVLVSQDTNILDFPTGYIYRITFIGELVTGNLPLIGVIQMDDTSCTNTVATTNIAVGIGVNGGTSTANFALTSAYDGENPNSLHTAYSVSQQFSVADEQFHIQQLVVSNQANNFVAGDTYTLKVITTSTVAIPWDASEAVLQLAITNAAKTALLPIVVGDNDIIVSRRTNADLAPHGFVYTIYFNGASVTGDMAALTVDTATGANIVVGNIAITTVRQGVIGATTLTENSIPLALPGDSRTSSPFLSGVLQQKLEVYKVNGFLWTMKFKSSIGNVPKLGKQTKSLTGGTMTILDDFVPGSASNVYVIPNLLPGINYHVHVAAWTDLGIGSFTPSSSIIPSSAASGVQNLAAGYALYEREVHEIRLAASHIVEIQEITTDAARVPEVQTLRTSQPGKIAFRVPTVQTVKIWSTAKINSGTFTLLFQKEVATSSTPGVFTTVGTPTGSINWNDDAATVKTALTAVNLLGTNDIVVTRDGDASVDFQFGYIFQITFIGNDFAGETNKIVCNKNFAATGGAATFCDVSMNTNIAMGTDTCVQQVIVATAKPLRVGSYKLHFNYLGADKVSDCIPFDASADTMETILERMPNIDNIFVTRDTYIDSLKNGFIYRIFFHGNGVYGDTPKLVWLSTDIGCTAFQTLENNVLTAVATLVDVKRIDRGGFDLSNTFVDSATDTAKELAEDLNQLPVFGKVLVSQSIKDGQGGYIWTVAFEDSQGNLPQFICAVDSATFTAASLGCETDTLTDGNVLSGSFLIESSSPIPFNADAVTLKTALEAMTLVQGTVQVKQSDPSPQFGYTWTITFMDFNGDVPMLKVSNLLVGTGSTISVREVRKGNSLGGTFTLTYASSVTASINWNAAAMAAVRPDGSSLQEKLEALDVVGRVNVLRTGPDEEGGYAWIVTFLDNILNSGDLPLLKGDATALTGQGAVVFIKELTKGSNAVGDQLWLSFDPPATDNGSPITRYQVRWDTSDKFNANPADVFISDADILYRTQRITTSAMSLAWSSNMITPVDEVQKLTIKNNPGTFTLSFRGLTTGPLTTGAVGAVVGVSTKVDLETALEALASVGSVDISSSDTVLTVGAEFLVTFRAQLGDLPLMSPDTANFVSVTEHQAGTTNFRKEVVVFKCTATSGTVRFTYKGKNADVNYNAALADVETSLATNFDLEPDSISVSSSPPQTTLCPGSSADISVRFDRVYGDISLTVGPSTVITPNTAASIDGVYNDDPALTMSGTFQVGYQGLYTRPLNAESSADQLRYALEDLDTIQTVGVSRDRSYRPLPGKVDVTQGEIFATCSAGETCNFYSAGYGLPGYVIRIGGDWYTVRTDTSSPGLHSSRLYLGDLSGREVGYLGSTDTAVTVYEWTKGYEWTVDMLSVSSPLGYLRSKVPRLYPDDSQVQIFGQNCDKCYYLPNQTTKQLTMGLGYYIEVYAYNKNEKGAVPVKGAVPATPSQVPAAPSNVNLQVVSGKEIEVFFSPPPLGTSNVSPNFNNDISSYIVQWDVIPTYKHGRQICASCATQLNTNTLSVSTSLMNLLDRYSKFTIGDDPCVLTVDVGQTATTVNVVTAHGCANFNGQTYPLYYYTYPPQVLSGSAIQGSPPFHYVISNLVAGKTYYMRVAAVNSVPVQKIALSGEPPDNRMWSYRLSATTANRVPDAPLSVYLNPFSATTLELQIQPSTRDGFGTGGTQISGFWIDVDIVSSFDSATKRTPAEIPKNGGLIQELYSGGPRTYYITGLTAGTRYYAQVKTMNSIGNSRATIAPSPQTPTQHPNSPVNVKANTLTVSSKLITSATVTWQKPADTGGLPLTGYKVEWWRSVSRLEIQTIELKWVTQPTAAPFTLSFGGLTTPSLPMDISADNLRYQLMSLAATGNIPMGHVEVSRVAINIVQGYQWSITFANADKNSGNQPLLQFVLGAVLPVTIPPLVVTGRAFEVQSGVAVPVSNSYPGKQEVQVLVTYDTSVVGGYFRLSYKGSAWTNYLSATVSSGDLKLALEALPTIGVVTVNLETMLLNNAAWSNGRVWTITFESNVGNLASLNVDSARITPSTAFIGIKDGDNAVGPSGLLCLPDGSIGCPGSWPIAIANLKQQAAPTKTIAQLARPGETAVDYGYFEMLDASTTTYSIPNLTPGNSYLVTVAAKNAQGLGPRTQSSPMLVTPPVQVPGPPVNVSVDVNPGVATQLVARWVAPASDGGSPIQMYRVEYDASSLFTARGQQDWWCPTAPTPAIWQVQTTISPGTDPIGSGYFKLQLTRKNIVKVSDPIPWNAVAEASDEASSVTTSSSGVFCTSALGSCTASQMQTSGSMQSKLRQFSQLSSDVEVTRSAMTAGGEFTWTITFHDGGDDFSLTPTGVNLACAAGTGCTGTYNVPTPRKSRAGVMPSSCTGSQVIPATTTLNKGQLYYVRVLAYNQIGFGDPQLAAAPQKPMVAPGPPTGVTLAVLTVSELVVLFNPPDDNGGDTVTGYEVQWATSAAFTSPTSTLVPLSSGMSSPYKRIISSLVKGTRYYVRVRARNSQNFGTFQVSSPTSQQPYTTPSSPTLVMLGITSSTMLTVGWTPPTDDGGDVVSGYVVQWDVAATFDSLATGSTTAVINDATQRSYTITLLTPGTLYYVRVYAKNSGGTGIPQTSTPASMIPVTTRPGKPNSLAVAATATTGQLQVVWQPPRVPAHGISCAGTIQSPQSCPALGGLDMVFGGVSLESYLVQYADSSDFSLAKEVSVTTTSAIITGLESGKTYYVRVLAVNSQGLNSDFCMRTNAQSLLCPDHLVLEDGSVVTGDFVSGVPK